VSSLQPLLDFLRRDIAKLIRFAAVSMITVPLGMFLYWLLLQTDMSPILGNVIAVTVSTIPNYILNRYWVWNKRGPNSVGREIAPFWMMAFLGLAISTGSVAIANRYTDNNLVFLAINFCSFGVVWVLKFFVLEKFLFADADTQVAEVAA